jgi:hypothetical protein
VIAFQPVVELSELEEEPFIMDYRFKKVSLDIPWMVGITSEEGLLKSACEFNLKPLNTHKHTQAHAY